MTDSSWFYSSLSQVTAAIVAFLGGFLILRLLDQMKDWTDLKVSLESAQRDWLRASNREDDHSKKSQTFDAELSNRVSEAWEKVLDNL